MKYIKTFESFLGEDNSKMKTVKFKDLKVEDGVKDGSYAVLHLPTGSDESTEVSTKIPGAEDRLENYKQKMMQRFKGIEDADVIIDPSKPWFHQVNIDFEELSKSAQKHSQGKAEWLKNKN
jgi:hypothetical protein